MFDNMKKPISNEILEKLVIGTLIDKPVSFELVESFLKPEHFNNDDHRRIYQAIIDLAAAHIPITPFAILDKSAPDFIHRSDFATYIMQLAQITVSRGHLADTARALITKQQGAAE
jgi:replicative DNA helicase